MDRKSRKSYAVNFVKKVSYRYIDLHQEIENAGGGMSGVEPFILSRTPVPTNSYMRKSIFRGMTTHAKGGHGNHKDGITTIEYVHTSENVVDLLESIIDFPNDESRAAFHFSKILFTNRKIAGPDRYIHMKHTGVPSGSYYRCPH